MLFVRDPEDRALADVREYVYTLQLARCLGESAFWFRRMLIDVINQEEERFGPQARLVVNPKQQS